LQGSRDKFVGREVNQGEKKREKRKTKRIHAGGASSYKGVREKKVLVSLGRGRG